MIPVSWNTNITVETIILHQFEEFLATKVRTQRVPIHGGFLILIDLFSMRSRFKEFHLNEARFVLKHSTLWPDSADLIIQNLHHSIDNSIENCVTAILLNNRPCDRFMV